MGAFESRIGGFYFRIMHGVRLDRIIGINSYRAIYEEVLNTTSTSRTKDCEVLTEIQCYCFHELGSFLWVSS